jgi:hypothetical protein
MEASMYRYGRRDEQAGWAGRSAARPPRRSAAVALERAPKKATRPEGLPRVDRRGWAARLEHGLFALTLGSIGYVWLGALLAEAVRGL